MFKICHLLISPYCACSVICVCCPCLLCMPSQRFVDSFTLAMKAFTPKRWVNATHLSFPLFDSQLVSIRQHTTMSSSRRQWLGLKAHEHLEQACRHHKTTFRFLPEKPQKTVPVCSKHIEYVLYVAFFLWMQREVQFLQPLALIINYPHITLSFSIATTIINKHLLNINDSASGFSSVM